MRPDRDIVVLADDVDVLVSRMRDDVDPGMADKKIRDHLAQRELHGGHARCEAHGADRFTQPMPYRGLRLFGLLQHLRRMAIEFAAGIGHPKPPRRAVEQPNAEARLELADAMAQGRFWKAK